MASVNGNLKRYKLVASYDGTRYKGFQRQDSGKEPKNIDSLKSLKRRRFGTSGAIKTPLTIQECIEDALERFSGLDRVTLKVRFAGRTDAGVHARGQVLAVSLPNVGQEMFQIQKSLNSRLPMDISIDKVTFCHEDFDPRTDVKWKRYSYLIKYRRKSYSKTDGSLLPICSSGPNSIRNALDPSFIWVVPWVLDDSKLDEFCRMLTGYHDYSVFVHKRARNEKSNVLELKKLSCEFVQKSDDEEAPVLTTKFVFEAKGFRRSMVRNLVGFLIDLCRGELEESIFEEIWSASDVNATARKLNSSPACGLCLEHVEY